MYVLPRLLLLYYVVYVFEQIEFKKYLWKVIGEEFTVQCKNCWNSLSHSRKNFVKVMVLLKSRFDEIFTKREFLVFHCGIVTSWIHEIFAKKKKENTTQVTQFFFLKKVKETSSKHSVEIAEILSHTVFAKISWKQWIY